MIHDMRGMVTELVDACASISRMMESAQSLQMGRKHRPKRSHLLMLPPLGVSKLKAFAQQPMLAGGVPHLPPRLQLEAAGNLPRAATAPGGKKPTLTLGGTPSTVLSSRPQTVASGSRASAAAGASSKPVPAPHLRGWGARRRMAHGGNHAWGDAKGHEQGVGRLDVESIADKVRTLTQELQNRKQQVGYLVHV